MDCLKESKWIKITDDPHLYYQAGIVLLYSISTVFLTCPRMSHSVQETSNPFGPMLIALVFAAMCVLRGSEYGLQDSRAI